MLTIVMETKAITVLPNQRVYPSENPEQDPKQDPDKDPNKILRAMAWQDPNRILAGS